MPLPLISARLPSALKKSVICTAYPSADSYQQTIGTDAAATVAALRQGRQVIDLRVEHDEEVVAESVVFGECDVLMRRVLPPRSVPPRRPDRE